MTLNNFLSTYTLKNKYKSLGNFNVYVCCEILLTYQKQVLTHLLGESKRPDDTAG